MPIRDVMARGSGQEVECFGTMLSLSRAADRGENLVGFFILVRFFLLFFIFENLYFTIEMVTTYDDFNKQRREML